MLSRQAILLLAASLGGSVSLTVPSHAPRRVVCRTAVPRPRAFPTAFMPPSRPPPAPAPLPPPPPPSPEEAVEEARTKYLAACVKMGVDSAQARVAMAFYEAALVREVKV